MMDAPTEIVGRDAELARSSSGRLAVRDLLPAGLVLEGEAGIGKTTLWRAAVEIAEAAGHRVLSCALAQGESRLAFAGLADLAADALADVSQALAEPQRAALEEALLLRTGIQPLPDERAVAFGFLGLLRALTSETPVTLAIDDVQWLDPSSAAMLSFAVRRLRTEPVLLLLARRLEGGAEPDPLQLERLRRSRSSGPHPTADAGRAPSAPPPAARVAPSRGQSLGRVHDRSSGNPLHALELVRALDSPATQAPGSLTGLLRSRVAALPEQTQTTLLLAALAAEPQLSTLSLAGELDAREALQPALASRARRARRRGGPLRASARGRSGRRRVRRCRAQRTAHSPPSQPRLKSARATWVSQRTGPTRRSRSSCTRPRRAHGDAARERQAPSSTRRQAAHARRRRRRPWPPPARSGARLLRGRRPRARAPPALGSRGVAPRRRGACRGTVAAGNRARRDGATPSRLKRSGRKGCQPPPSLG